MPHLETVTLLLYDAHSFARTWLRSELRARKTALAHLKPVLLVSSIDQSPKQDNVSRPVRVSTCGLPPSSNASVCVPRLLRVGLPASNKGQ